MDDTPKAKLLKRGSGQIVCLPKGFHIKAKEVRLRRIGRSVLLEPVEVRRRRNFRAIFAKIDRLVSSDFLSEGRPEQQRATRGRSKS